MTTRHRTFTPKARAASLEPVTFDLFGQIFKAVPQIQGIVLMELVEATEDGEKASVGALLQFLKSTLIDGDFERLNDLLHSNDPSKIVSIEDIADIVSFLVGEYTSRPTEAS